MADTAFKFCIKKRATNWLESDLAMKIFESVCVASTVNFSEFLSWF